MTSEEKTWDYIHLLTGIIEKEHKRTSRFHEYSFDYVEKIIDDEYLTSEEKINLIKKHYK